MFGEFPADFFDRRSTWTSGNLSGLFLVLAWQFRFLSEAPFILPAARPMEKGRHAMILTKPPRTYNE
jgi:hypothetical protein